MTIWISILLLDANKARLRILCIFIHNLAEEEFGSTVQHFLLLHKFRQSCCILIMDQFDFEAFQTILL